MANRFTVPGNEHSESKSLAAIAIAIKSNERIEIRVKGTLR